MLCSLLAVVFLHSACTEVVTDPCANNSNITIKIKGKNFETCEGITQEYPAPDASITIIHYDVGGSSIDTLISSFLNSSGELEYTIPNSQCGINNIKLVAVNNSSYFEDSIDFMCCDTTYVFSFERDCEESPETEIACETINETIDVKLANLYKGCLMVGASQADIRWNSVSVNTSDEIRVDVSEVLALEDKFFANISPEPDDNGDVYLNANELNISFFVETDEVGVFDTQLSLPTICTDGSGNEHTGQVLVNLTAEICEDGCVCPFSNDGEVNKTIDRSAYPVSVGSTMDYSSESIFTVRDGMLDSDCYLIITSVDRFNSSEPATSFSEAHDWIITTPDELVGQQIRLYDTFNMSAEFEPEKSGESIDTFEIFVDVYNRVDELKESCSFIVEYKGAGCENVCPEITKMNSLTADFVDPANGDILQNLKWGDKVQMGTGNTINQRMSGNLGNMCRGVITGSETVSYLINVADNEDVLTCSDVNINYQIVDNGNTGDRAFFSVIDDFMMLGSGGNGIMSIRFHTPDAKAHIQSNHDDVYKARLIIEATNTSGEFICSQTVDLSAQVYQNTVSVSEPMSMKAFSQVSDKEPESAYQVYKIDIYDEDYNYFGKIDNLSMNHIDYTTTPPSPQSNHSFYFEVAQPQNTILRQYPKLFLVKYNGKLDYNRFTRVTEKPVANYSSNGDFSSDLDNLIDHVFNEGAFTSLGNAPTYNFQFSEGESYGWEPFRTAEQMALDGIGVDIKLGDVFIIWNPNGTAESFTSGGNTFSSYCDVAFLYIDGLSDGTNTNHNIGFVSFYVAYPLSVIQN